MPISSAQAVSDPMPPPLLGPRVALFLDFDGTLAPLAQRPDEVQVHPALPALLAAAGRRLGGALAVITGRRLEDVDRRLAPFAFGGGGLHGAGLRSGPDRPVRAQECRDVNKGRAVRALLQEPPFAGRRPVFVGDDVTDEDGFAAAAALGGYGIKIGDGATAADYRLDRPEDIFGWLQASLEAGSTGC